MKRFVTAALLMLMILCLAACGSEAQKKAETAAKPAAPQETAPEDANWYFVKDDVRIEIGEKAEPILKALGDPRSTYEAPSCALDGMDVVYTYPGFEVLTYVMDDGEAKISGVVLRDDTVETAEGICIGSSKADVQAAYGNIEEGAANLRVTKGNCELLVILTDDAVSSIQYLMADKAD